MLKPKLFTVLKDYNRQQFIKDLTAGSIVAVIALPLSIALAIASGVSPEKGIHTAIIAGFLIAFFGGSRVQIGGPTGAFVIIVSGIVHRYGIDGLIVSTLMAGVIILFFGLLKFGSFVKFIPYPITTGFTSGIALVIFSTQVKDFFGLSVTAIPDDFIPKWHKYFTHFDTFNPATLIIGVLSLLVIIYWSRINKRIPGSLVAIIIATLAVKIWNIPVETVGSKFGTISASFPAPSFPVVTFAMIKDLIPPAVTIALLASIESLLSAVVADGMISGRHRPNMELVAQGIANIGSALFGGIPATGAIARTAANIKNGGRTPVAGIVHALVLLVILLLLMPLASYIPLATLAAILMVVAYNMSEWHAFRELLKAPRGDAAVFIMTFALTVFVGLVQAIEVGMVLAAFLFMKRMADSAHAKSILQETEDLPDPDEFKSFNRRYIPDGVEVFEINGPFFFGAADKFFNTICQVNKSFKVLILRMRHVPTIDATGYHMLRRIFEECRKQHARLIISNLQSQPYRIVLQYNFQQLIGEENLCRNFEEALLHAGDALKENTG